MNSFIKKISELDILSKFIIIFLAIVLSYILIICFLVPMILSPANGFSEEYILSFSTPEHRHLNLISVLLAISMGAAFSILTRYKTDENEKTFKAIKTVLSPAEKKAVDIIEEAGEITQDSLMFRLEWSRAKVCTTLTNLEKRNLIQRRREGKTYVVYLAKTKK